jgi:hypothetical protein
MGVVPPNEKPALLVRVRLAEPERIGLPRLATSPTGPSLTTIDILQECYAKVKIDEVRLCDPHKGALPTAMLMRPDRSRVGVLIKKPISWIAQLATISSFSFLDPSLPKLRVRIVR